MIWEFFLNLWRALFGEEPLEREQQRSCCFFIQLLVSTMHRASNVALLQKMESLPEPRRKPTFLKQEEIDAFNKLIENSDENKMIQDYLTLLEDNSCAISKVSLNELEDVVTVNGTQIYSAASLCRWIRTEDNYFNPETDQFTEAPNPLTRRLLKNDLIEKGIPAAIQDKLDPLILAVRKKLNNANQERRMNNNDEMMASSHTSTSLITVKAPSPF